MKKHATSGKTTFSRKHHRAYFWLGVFLILLTGCSTPTATPEPPEAPGSGGSSVVIYTFTPAPPSSSIETVTPTPEPTLNAQEKGRIPGLSPRNVTVTLEHNQFTCTLPVKGNVYYERTCTRGVPGAQVFRVVIYGQLTGAVDFIEATIMQYENPEEETAIEILDLIVSLPYDGAIPDEASAWLENTVPALNGDMQETTFSGVKYVLSGPPNKLMLEMGELP